jgi:hypothetical protein
MPGLVDGTTVSLTWRREGPATVALLIECGTSTLELSSDPAVLPGEFRGDALLAAYDSCQQNFLLTHPEAAWKLFMASPLHYLSSLAPLTAARLLNWMSYEINDSHGTVTRLMALVGKIGGLGQTSLVFRTSGSPDGEGFYAVALDITQAAGTTTCTSNSAVIPGLGLGSSLVVAYDEVDALVNGQGTEHDARLAIELLRTTV